MSTVGAPTGIPAYDPTLTTPAPTGPQSTAGTTATTEDGGTPPASPPASYLSLPFPRLTLENLGLQPVNGFQNVAVLIDQVAAALDAIFNENDKQRIAGETSERRNAFNLIINLKTGVEALEARNAQLDQIIAAKEAEKAPLVQQRQQLTNQRQGLINQVQTLNGQRQTLEGQIATLDQQIAAETNPAKKAELQAQRAAKVGELNGVNGQISSLNGQIATLNAQIDALTAQIDAIQQVIDQSTAEKNDNINRIHAMEGQIANLASALFLTRAGIERLLGRDVPQSGVDLSFEEIVDALQDFDARLQEVEGFGKLQKLYEQDIDLATAIAKALLAFVEAMNAALKTLAGIEPPPDADLYRTALTNGARMRLPA